MARRGRPTKFKQEFVAQARKLAELGATDREIAEYAALTFDDFAKHWLRIRREDRLEVIAVQKRERASSRRRLMQNPSARIRNAVQARLWAALKGRSDGALFSRLGYSSNDLARHLEERFSEGMSWENYGLWHVDHRRPCAVFDQTDPAQFAECWALDNLQPLWASDNIQKGARDVAA